MRYALGIVCCSIILLATGSAFGATLASWDFHTDAQSIADGIMPSVTDPGIVGTAGLTRGSGIISITTSRVFSSTNWGDDTNGFAAYTTEADAITGGDYITFSLTPTAGDTASYSTLDYTIRRTSGSPNTMIWQYSVGAGPFTDIGSANLYNGTNQTDTNGLFQPTVDLSTISALQNESATVTFRFVAWGFGTNAGSFGFGRSAGSSLSQNSLVLGGTVNLPFLAGDVNNDGHVNSADISAMMAALTDPNITVNPLSADVNGDGSFTNADLQSLLQLLKSGGGSTSAVPEPNSCIIFLLAAPALAFAHLRRRAS